MQVGVEGLGPCLLHHKQSGCFGFDKKLNYLLVASVLNQCISHAEHWVCVLGRLVWPG